MCGASCGGVEPGVASEPPSQPTRPPLCRELREARAPLAQGLPLCRAPPLFSFCLHASLGVEAAARLSWCSRRFCKARAGGETPSPPATPLKPQTAAPTQHTFDPCSLGSPPNPSSLQCRSLLAMSRPSRAGPRGGGGGLPPAGDPGGEGCGERPWLPGLARWPLLPSCAGVGEQTQGQAPRSAPEGAAVESQALGSGFGTLREETGSSLGAPSCRAWEPGSSLFLPQLFGACAKPSSGDQPPYIRRALPCLSIPLGGRGAAREETVPWGSWLRIQSSATSSLGLSLPPQPACVQRED